LASAFEADGPALSRTAIRSLTAYLGLLQLADWLESDEARPMLFLSAKQMMVSGLDFARARARSLDQSYCITDFSAVIV
jgi:hypothetical protein